MRIFKIVVLCLSVVNFSTFAQGESSSDFEKGFGEAEGISEAEKLGADVDKVKIGGSLTSDFFLLGTEGSGASDNFYNPYSLWVYLDANLRNEIRAYAKAKLIWANSSNPLLSSSPPSASTELEELKLFFNADKRVFFTVGKQKIKWGAGKFWNPTDFLNNEKRDLLDSDDLRSGVTLLKSHMPFGKSNLYLVQSLDGASRINKIGHTLRLELPLGSSELSFTASKLKDAKAFFGTDVSLAVGSFDLHGEVAYQQDSKQAHVVGGIGREFGYGDNDTWGVSLEYFGNASGISNTANYAPALATSVYTPFYFSRHYAMLLLYLPSPGTWNKTTINLFNVFNLTDQSILSKLNFSFEMMQDLRWDVGASYRYGKSDGEFRFFSQRYDLSTSLSVDF